MTHDPAPERGPRTAGEKLAVAACVVAFIAAMLAELGTDPAPRKLSAVFFILAWVPLLFLHEAGHAIVARSLGFGIERVVLGFGARRGELSVCGVLVELRTVPLTGFVAIRPRRGRSRSRLADALVYAAGPGIELALAFALGSLVGWSRFLTLSEDTGLVALQSLAAAGATGAALNLLPGSASSARGEVPSDGLGIFLALFGRR